MDFPKYLIVLAGKIRLMENLLSLRKLTSVFQPVFQHTKHISVASIFSCFILLDILTVFDTKFPLETHKMRDSKKKQSSQSALSNTYIGQQCVGKQSIAYSKR